jgi:hypothetical protein
MEENCPLRNFIICMLNKYRDALLGNPHNTHAANNRGAVFSVVRPATVDRQRAIHAANNIGVVFSVLWSDPSLYNRSQTA